MANHLTLEDMRPVLRDAEAVSADPFWVLQVVTSLVNRGPEDDAREAVLRALEHKARFSPYEDVLDSLASSLGLFPYADEGNLSLAESIAYEFHRPFGLGEEVVFHREQAEVYRHLLRGENLVVSAPTSFGKSKIVDALIASGKYKNIVVVVPTLALIDETRRRVSGLGCRHKIITQIGQRPAEYNIFILTGERVMAYEDFPKVDLFVLDEFYKIGALGEDESRTVALNQAFAKLLRMKPQLYLLGPSVRALEPGTDSRFPFRLFQTDFQTVVADEHRIPGKGREFTRLLALGAGLNGPTIVYCKSPGRANAVAQAFLEGGLGRLSPASRRAADWIGEHFHEEWTFARALARGIGIHHGRLPRALAQYVVRAFNEGVLDWLICTSTLIEGVNTRAKNVVVFDKKVASSDFDYFTFNNIRGRSGRMFMYFVGNVYLFHDPPHEQLPLVEFPLFSQGAGVPESLLLQLEDSELAEGSRQRLQDVFEQGLLPLGLLRSQPAVEPRALLKLAEALSELSSAERASICWSGLPTYEELAATCDLIWKCLVDRAQGGVYSGAQLAFRANQLRSTPNVRQRVLAELGQRGRWAPRSPSEAVEKVLEFDRSWASFHLPKYLLAFDAVRRHLLGRGDYSLFAARIENLFRGPHEVALEEYGLPMQVSGRFSRLLGAASGFDEALELLRLADPAEFLEHQFERELFENAIEYF